MKEDSGTPGTAELSGGVPGRTSTVVLFLVSLISLGMHIPPDKYILQLCTFNHLTVPNRYVPSNNSLNSSFVH